MPKPKKDDKTVKFSGIHCKCKSKVLELIKFWVESCVDKIRFMNYI